MALDALFFGAHPDDVELTSAGLAALLASHGHAVGIVDLTRGEAASRGTPEERAREAGEAAKLLGVAERMNLGLPDLGLDRSDHVQLRVVAGAIRTHRPRLVVAPHHDDAHPDHIEAAHLVARACYISGLLRFDASGERHRPARVLFALYRTDRPPQLVVDVSAVWERRAAALAAHRSQLDPLATEAGGGGRVAASTYLTPPDGLAEVEARSRSFGALIGARYGEGYRLRGPVAIHDARALIGPPAGGVA
jgi:bacillithiol biosynthesis deacetylase BshB1